MKFSVTQSFSYPSARTAATFTNPALYPWFAKLPKVGTPPQVLGRDADEDTVRMQIRYRFGGDLAPAARAMIDPAKLTWVEESSHDVASHAVTFVLVPDNYGTQFRCRGSYRFVDTATGCRREAEIELKVKVPLVGRAVEGAIASGLKEHLEDEVAIVEAFMAAQDQPSR